MTDQRRLEDELRQAQKLDAIGQLAGGVAHDFNNLLTVILGNLELARLSDGPPPADLLTATERAARRAAELTSQLLGFARRRPLAVRPIDVGDTVRETAALLRRTIDPRITLVAEPGEPAVAVADPGQTAQVLMNLALNARDAMPDGGLLTLTAHPPIEWSPPPGGPGIPGRYVRLTVADTGVGMDVATRSRIFEPFFSTKPTGQGTGLGLAVAFGIVTAHGGWIDCTSAPGQGARFDVYLPAADGPARPLTPPPSPSPLGSGERVLLADDEPMVRRLADLALTRVGYRVTVAADGAEAVERFRADGPFDLVILDLTMPVLSGAEALAAVKRLAPGQKVLLASGYAADLSGPAAAADGFLEKPYTPAMLAKAVREVLGP